MKRLGLLLMVIVVALLISVPNEAATIHACRKKIGGTIRIVSPKAVCLDTETKISWNSVGLQGPQGEKGDSGVPGVLLFYKREVTGVHPGTASALVLTANCEPGDQVTGGGFEDNWLEGGMAVARYSRPTNDLTGWTVQWLTFNATTPFDAKVIAVCADLTTTQSPITSGVTNCGTHGGHTYYCSTETKTWSEARTVCESFGAYLAVISDQNENDAVNGFITVAHGGASGADSMVGLHEKDGVEGNWYWVNDTPLSGYSYWGEDGPNNVGGVENVAEIVPPWGGQWNDCDGTEPNLFVCEKD